MLWRHTCLASYDNAKISSRNTHTVSVIIHFMPLIVLMFQQIHESIKQLITALSALTSKVFSWIGEKIIVKAQEKRLQLQGYYTIGHGVMFHCKIELEYTEHAVHHFVNQIFIPTAPVRLQ